MPAGQLAIWTPQRADDRRRGGAAADRRRLAQHPLLHSLRLPFWALVLGFAAAERFVVHVHFRRSAHSMSMGEIPLVFGLLFATGPQVVFAHALGRLIILALQRKLPPLRLAFNLGQFLLGGCLAVLVFRGVAGSASDIDPGVWGAVALATIANSVMAVLLISAAVSLSDVRLSVRQIAVSLRTDLTMVLATTSLGLCAVTLVYRDWRTAILMAVPVLGMFLMFHAYTTERQRHERVEFLYESARALSHASEIGPAMEALLARALEAFRAQTAEIVFFSPTAATRCGRSSSEDGSTAVFEALDAAVAGQVRALAERAGARSGDHRRRRARRDGGLRAGALPGRRHVRGHARASTAGSAPC